MEGELLSIVIIAGYEGGGGFLWGFDGPGVLGLMARGGRFRGLGWARCEVNEVLENYDDL